MGVYDSFILITPMQCPVCYTGSYREFQTKSLKCLMDCYYEGKPAVQYYWEDLTEQELLNEQQMDRLLWGEDSPLATWHFYHKNSDKIRRKLEDGVYTAYHYCKSCNEFIYIHAIVKNGIFIGIQEKRGLEL